MKEEKKDALINWSLIIIVGLLVWSFYSYQTNKDRIKEISDKQDRELSIFWGGTTKYYNVDTSQGGNRKITYADFLRQQQMIHKQNDVIDSLWHETGKLKRYIGRIKQSFDDSTGEKEDPDDFLGSQDGSSPLDRY